MITIRTRRPGRRPRRPGLLLVLLAVVAASCGSTQPSTTPSPVGSPEPTDAATPTAEPTSAETPDVQGLLDSARSAYGAPGALALVQLGESRVWAASGSADVDGTPISETTRFRIASITKPIVAALVLDAVGRGELELDAVVSDLVPVALAPEPAVTVRQLLDHSSGIADASNDFSSLEELVEAIGRIPDPTLRAEAEQTLEAYAAGQRVVASDRVLVALSETRGRYFAPGTESHYSNTNYQLAAMVLEAVTGTSLGGLLAARVIEPLGLLHTTLAPPDPDPPELHGYGTATADGSLVDLTDDLSLFGNGGNGGIISTADELLTTLQAIVGGRLLPADLTATMKEPSWGTIGLGIGAYRLSCGTFYGHEGGVNGTASIAMVSSDGTDGVVVAMNLRSGEDPRLPALADALLCGG